MLIVIFLMGFAIGGLVLQWAVAGLVGGPLSPFIASVLAAASAVPVVRVLGGLIARYVPRDESLAVSEDSFIGRVARLTAESDALARPSSPTSTGRRITCWWNRMVPTSNSRAEKRCWW